MSIDPDEFEAEISHDDGQAARDHLESGRAIYYGDPKYPDGIVKEYPDGRRQLVRVVSGGNVSVVRDL